MAILQWLRPCYFRSSTRINNNLFNIFLRDLFLEDKKNYLVNYTDDTTPYLVGITTAEVLKNLVLPKKLFSWFANNQTKANDGKCYLILSFSEEDAAVQIDESSIKCLKVTKLIGILIDYWLKCDTHVENVCKKDHRRLIALTGITIYLELLKRRILMNVFLKLSLTMALLFGCFIAVI